MTALQEFEETNAALKELDALLACNLCHKISDKLFSGPDCIHIFCESCIENEFVGGACDLCLSPVQRKKAKPTVGLNRILKIVANVKNAVNKMSVAKDNKCVNENTRTLNNTMEETIFTTPAASGNRQMYNVRSQICSPLIAKRRKTELSSTIDPVNSRDFQGNTTLQKVCMCKIENAKLVESLLNNGANPNVRDNLGWTPLHEACSLGHNATVVELIKFGALIDVPGGDKLVTPLHDAVSHGHKEVVKTLLTNGADAKRRDIFGRTPLDYAKLKGYVDLIDLMTDYVEGSIKRNIDGVDRKSCLAAYNSVKEVFAVTQLLDENDKSYVNKLANIFQTKCLNVVNNRITHLIVPVGYSGRTMKYVQALALGKWIVTMDWVKACLKSNGRVSEEPYEVSGTKDNWCSGAPKFFREKKMFMQPPLYAGACVYLRDFEPIKKEEVKRLMLSAGAKIATREPTKDDDLLPEHNTVLYHAEPDSEASLVNFLIIFDTKSDNREKDKSVNTKRIRTVSFKKILDCFENHELSGLLAQD